MCFRDRTNDYNDGSYGPRPVQGQPAQVYNANGPSAQQNAAPQKRRWNRRKAAKWAAFGGGAAAGF